MNDFYSYLPSPLINTLLLSLKGETRNEKAYELLLPKTQRDFPKTQRDFPKTQRDFPKTQRDFFKTQRDSKKHSSDLFGGSIFFRRSTLASLAFCKNIANKLANLLCTRKWKEKHIFLLHFPRFFGLREAPEHLLERKQFHVLLLIAIRSSSARLLPSGRKNEHPTMSHQPFYDSSSGTARRRRRRLLPKGRKKGNHFFWIHQMLCLFFAIKRQFA